MLLAFSHQTNSVRYLGMGLYTMLSTSQQCLCSATAVSFSRYYIFLGLLGAGAAGDEISDKTRTTICGVSDKTIQNNKITK